MKTGKSAGTNGAGFFRVRFWGVRGSYPTPDARTLAFGGHTSCVEVQVGGHRLIFDAGTGIIPLGREIANGARQPQTLNLFFSHTHHDHVFGFYFFEPLFQRGNRVCIFGPSSPGKSLKKTLQAAMQSRFFPVPLRDLKAYKKIYSLRGGERIRLRRSVALPKLDRRWVDPSPDDVTVEVLRSSAHPNGVLLYRVCYRDKSIVYATDIEQTNGGYPDIIEFIQSADVLIHDAQYLNREYRSASNPRKGWGHSTVEGAVEVARKGRVKKLILFHHEPTHDDKIIKAMEFRAQRRFPAAMAAWEGMTLDVL